MNSTLLREFGKLQNSIWQSRQEATEEFPRNLLSFRNILIGKKKHRRVDSTSGVLEVGARFSVR